MAAESLNEETPWIDKIPNQRPQPSIQHFNIC